MVQFFSWRGYHSPLLVAINILPPSLPNLSPFFFLLGLRIAGHLILLTLVNPHGRLTTYDNLSVVEQTCDFPNSIMGNCQNSILSLDSQASLKSRTLAFRVFLTQYTITG